MKVALYKGKFWGGMGMGDTGLQPDWVAKALKQDGLSQTWNDYGDFWTHPDQTTIDTAKQFGPIELVRMPWYNNDIILSIKRSLAFGFPVIIVLNLCTAFWNIPPGNWRTMDWDANDLTRGEHAVCIVGYDDACGRFLIENSWGSHNGDGGFYGFPYDKFLPGPQSCVTNYWRLETFPAKAVKVPGFVAGSPTLLANEASDFYVRYRPQLQARLNNFSGQGLINECVRLGISDKMLEALKGWARLSLVQNNPGLDFSAMHFDSPTGYTFITSTECLEFVSRNKQAAFEHFESVLTPLGVVAMMQEAKLLGYSDKHIEYLANWERGLIQQNAAMFGVSLSDIILDLL